MNNGHDHQIEPYHYHLRPGYIFANSDPSLISAVVGSGVAVCVWDRVSGIGGMSHFQYPAAGRRDKRTAKFGDVSVKTLVRMLQRMGARLENMEAQLFGGGHRYEYAKNIGKRNIRIARKALKKSRIPIISEDIGGRQCRRVLFHTRTNEVLVMKTSKSRQVDWYPYYTRT